MSDESNKQHDDEKNPKKGGEFKVPPRTWVVWIAIFGGIILLMLMRDKWESQGEIVGQSKFQQLVDSNQIAKAIINYSPQNLSLTEVSGQYYKTDPSGNRIKDRSGQEEVVQFRAKVRLYKKLEARILNMPQFEGREPNTMLFSVLWSVLPIVVIAAFIWFFFIRQIKMA